METKLRDEFMEHFKHILEVLTTVFSMDNLHEEAYQDIEDLIGYVLSCLHEIRDELGKES